MDWITIKLMEYQLKKAKRQKSKAKESFVESAYLNLITNYKNTIMYLKANRNN